MGVIDDYGYRLNVGIILVNHDNQLFWGRRLGSDAWQFPQGGVKAYETLQETMYRELKEELGLQLEDVKILGITKRWLYYRLPYHMRRHHQKPLCIGQKQKWFLLKLLSNDDKIHLDETDPPEFVAWRWINYWEPIKEIIAFKYMVYKQALSELEPLLDAVLNSREN